MLYLSQEKINSIKEDYNHLFNDGYNIPDHTKNALDRYAITGKGLSGFTEAIVTNDLMKAYGQADKWNRKALNEIVQYMMAELPYHCYGSKEAVQEWSKQEGLYGKHYSEI